MSTLKNEVLRTLGRGRIYDMECMCGEGFGETVLFFEDDIEEFPFTHERCAWCGDIVSNTIEPDWDAYWAWRRAQEDARGEDNAATNRLNNRLIEAQYGRRAGQ